jgi:hypothetical protein
LTAPTLTPTLADSVVVIDWAAPHDQLAAYGAIIIQYRVLIMQADLEYSEVSVDCPGTDVDLISNTQCTVQISTLKADPFSLEHEMPIYAKIVAINTIGESDASDLKYRERQSLYNRLLLKSQEHRLALLGVIARMVASLSFPIRF